MTRVEPPMPPMPASAPIPAATVIVFRDRRVAPAELLMVERSAAMAFAAGAMVFPGGRVDPGDRVLAAEWASHALDHDDAAARIAAIRETLEEAGIAIGLDPVPDGETLAALRRRLLAGEAFGALLAEAGIRPTLSALEPFARWLPGHDVPRVFDTRFYLARLPEGSSAGSADDGESVRLVWSTAAAMLAEEAKGRAHLIFPTRRNLERLATLNDHAAAIAHARAHPIRTITPVVEMRHGVEQLCIPGGLGYPILAEPVDRAMRG